MHLDTIQHLRSLATQHDDLVPVAKPLLLDLLDTYERHADTQRRLNAVSKRAEAIRCELVEAGIKQEATSRTLAATMQARDMVFYDSPEGRIVITAAHAQALEELAKYREAGTPARWIPVTENLPAPWAWVLVWGVLEDAPRPCSIEGRLRFTDEPDSWEASLTASWGEHLKLSQVTHWMPMPAAPAADSDTLPDPADQRHYQLAHADLKKPALKPTDVLTDTEEQLAQFIAALSTMITAARMVMDAYDPRYFRAGKWLQGAIQACSDVLPPTAPDAAPVNEVIQSTPSHSSAPEPLNIVILQQLLKAEDYDAIETVKAAALDYLDSLNPCPLDFSHQPHDHCDGSAASQRGTPPVNPVNEVTQVTPTPESPTFEAHGHTWTRHTPGDPCPVPEDTRVHVLLKNELQDPRPPEPNPAWHFVWTYKSGNGFEIIGWRHASPQNPS